MIFVFLVDTSVSMEQELTVAPQTISAAENGSLFGGGSKDCASRRWQRKSMNTVQERKRSKRGTRLDCAKNIVEQIVTNRQYFEHDRYMLVTYAGSSANSGNSCCIKSHLRDPRTTLQSRLRGLVANDQFMGGTSLTTLFNQLSLMRSSYDIDTYGYGRYPALHDPVQIVWLSDGGSMVTDEGVQSKLNLPVVSAPWVEAYLEPFRWDQRLSLVLLHKQGDGNPLCSGGRQSSEDALLPMCSVMGGTVHHVSSLHQAQRFVESFAPARCTPNSGRTQGPAMPAPGVLVNFERIDDNPSNPGNSDLRVLLHASPSTITNNQLPPSTDPSLAAAAAAAATGGLAIGGSNNSQPSRNGSGGYGNSAGMTALINGQLGYFPIPEAFWPETIVSPRNSSSNSGNSSSASQQGNWQIPRRNAHPTLGYSQVNVEWAVPPQFPFDKYQIDINCSVTQKLLAAAHAAQSAYESQDGKGPAKTVCWQVFVNGSYTNPKNSGFPFGILRPNTARTAVNLFILPYNYSALWKILGKLEAQAQSQNTSRNTIAMSSGWRRELEEYLQHTPGYYAIPLKRAFNLYGIPHGVFPKTFGQSAGMCNITQYSQRLHAISRKEWERLVPGSSVDGSPAVTGPNKIALGLQRALLEFDISSDVTHLVTNPFDVDRSHCLATLNAMRRVFMRECMTSQSAYFRANTLIPPSAVETSDKGDDMDVDEGIDTPALVPTSPSTPPVGTIEYSFYGFPNALDGSGSSPLLSPLNGPASSPLGVPPQSRGAGPDQQRLEPGMHYSPMGGLVDVASEDDRDSRHSVPIREMGEYGPAVRRVEAQEPRDPLLDERDAQQQRRNLFGNPYRRTAREPRSANNNMVARIPPELANKLGLSKNMPSTSRAPGSSNNSANGAKQQQQPQTKSSFAEEDVDGDAAGLEMASEADINDIAMDKMVEGISLEPEAEKEERGDNNKKGSGVGSHQLEWIRRKDVPRRRSINTPWRKGDKSWNVNPWDNLDVTSLSSGNRGPSDLGSIMYTADAVVIDRRTSAILSSEEDEVVSKLSDVATAADSRDLEMEENCSQQLEDKGRVDEQAAAAAAPLLPDPHKTVEVEPQEVETAIETTTMASKVNVSEEKAWFLKRIKAAPAQYDEDAIVKRMDELQNNSSLSKAHLKLIVAAATSAARSMRRKQLVERLQKKQ